MPEAQRHSSQLVGGAGSRVASLSYIMNLEEAWATWEGERKGKRKRDLPEPG